MGWTKVDTLPRFGFHPSAEDVPTGEDKRMPAVSIDDGKLEVAIKWRGRYRLPLHCQLIRLVDRRGQ
jgi:hypothetical protein